MIPKSIFFVISLGLLFGCLIYVSDIQDMTIESLNDKWTDHEGNVIIYVKFYDSQGNQINDNGLISIPVEVSVFTSKYDVDGVTRIPDRLLYNANHTIKNLEKANNLVANEGHILVPRSQLGEIYEDDLRYGVATVTAHLPYNKTLEDIAYLVRLKD